MGDKDWNWDKWSLHEIRSVPHDSPLPSLSKRPAIPIDPSLILSFPPFYVNPALGVDNVDITLEWGDGD